MRSGHTTGLEFKCSSEDLEEHARLSIVTAVPAVPADSLHDCVKFLCQSTHDQLAKLTHKVVTPGLVNSNLKLCGF